MILTDFIPNFIEHSKSEGYSFLIAVDQFSEPQKASMGRQALIAAAAATAFTAAFGGGAVVGAIAGSNVGYSDKIRKEDLVADLQRMKEYCDLIGINLSYGATIVRMMIDADTVSGETLVGRCAMIHERGLDFRKYALTIAKSWLWGDTKAGTVIEVVMTFSTHKLAREFLQNYADKCKYSRKGVTAYPWIVDLEDHEITRKTLNLPFFSKKYDEKLKAGFFRKSN